MVVSSAGHQLSPIRWDDIHFDRGYDRSLAYAQSKPANALFAVRLDALGRDPADPSFKTPEQGAATQVWADTSPQLDGLGGLYCEDCDIAEPTDSTEMIAGVRDHAVDPAEAERLWALSAELTGISAF